MKLETGIVLAKGLCFVTIGACAPMSTALAQYANTGDWPSRIVWTVIIIASITGGATQLLSFLSGSFTNYMQGRTPTGNTQFISKPPSP